MYHTMVVNQRVMLLFVNCVPERCLALVDQVNWRKCTINTNKLVDCCCTGQVWFPSVVVKNRSSEKNLAQSRQSDSEDGSVPQCYWFILISSSLNRVSLQNKHISLSLVFHRGFNEFCTPEPRDRQTPPREGDSWRTQTDRRSETHTHSLHSSICSKSSGWGNAGLTTPVLT